MSKPVVLTGIRANNDLHIGNYFGALLPMIDMAKNKSEQYQINLFVPDLHSFTTPIDYRQLQSQIIHNLKIFVAAGLPLDNPDIHIYRQSFISAHAELTWILDCFTGVGEMQRMTQFKDKSAKLQSATDEQNSSHSQISVGLFNYPVLMAADILLYDAEYVPVGDDQTQHLEYTRDIAMRMNNRFAEQFADGLFKVPEAVPKQHEFFGKDQGLRVRDLSDPTKKMSKSDDSSKGIVFMGDNPDEAATKIMSAATDSVGKINLDWANQPGVSNILQMLALLEQRTINEVMADWEGKGSYSELKQSLATKVHDFLVDFQSKLDQVDESAIFAKLQSSEDLMRTKANETLYRAQQAVGLRPMN